jgi:hypothetical protein
MSNLDTPNKEDEELRIAISRAFIKPWFKQFASGVGQTTVEVKKEQIDVIMQIIKSRDQRIALEAQTNAIAWAVGIIDKMHFSSTGDDDDNDPTFKGIKSALRGQYEEATGIDPAPNYPISATLKQSQKDE